MNADAIRQFFDYHFSENRKLWDRYITSLTPAQFTQESDYSHGSVKNQVLHLISVDQAWFSDLRGVAIPEDPALDDLDAIRAHWDNVEREIRDYLDTVQDDMLFDKPFPPGEDENLILWQVLLHVVNHGTDHRAQLLRLLNDLGVETQSQDFIFYVYEHQ